MDDHHCFVSAVLCRVFPTFILRNASKIFFNLFLYDFTHIHKKIFYFTSTKGALWVKILE